MSVINKKPFIAELLNGLESVQVTELFKCLDYTGVNSDSATEL